MPKLTDMPKKQRAALGQGLEALIPLEGLLDRKVPERDITLLQISRLIPSPFQPRRLFAEDSLADLSVSIKEKGVIQPLIVRPAANGLYEIVAGERRWRAAQMAGFSEIPAIVRNMSDSESLEIALIENLQRENLNPLDTAEAYDVLIKKFSYTHEVLAQRIGKDRTNITNHLRLLRLPDSIKQEVRQDRLSMGHARTLLAVEHLPTQLSLSQRIIKRKLSVRELEKIVQNFKAKQQSSEKQPQSKDPNIKRLESSLSHHFSTKVSIRENAAGSGRLELHFHSLEELNRLLEAIGYSEDLS
jgi:ParB family transcriptional regulator, chromosome partitioning protein